MLQPVTLTIRRPIEDITVAMVRRQGRWYITEALDEDGNAVKLTATEAAEVYARAAAGEDETGVEP